MTSLTSNSTSSEEPEAYRFGHVPFVGTTIWLDSRPLIPRTETEWWVEKYIAQIHESRFKNHESISILDLFAGSGCVGVAVLKHIHQAHVTFGELEARHLPTIEKNIHENGIDPNRARMVQTDVYASVVGQRYDFILANPPYLSRTRLSRVEGSVLAHEPEEALFADDDGFALIAATIEGLRDHLVPGGQAWVEHEPEHAERLKALGATTHKDQYGVERYSVCTAAVILNP